MIVCSCNVLSDHQVRAAMNESAPRMTSEVYGCLGCSAQCGRCARTIRRIMDQALGACAADCTCSHHPREQAREGLAVNAIATAAAR